jgi:diketogulonate reductase-like aldo/keto reductase
LVLTDYVDLFLNHDPLAGKAKRLQAYKALVEGKAAGKIRSVGVSN